MKKHATWLWEQSKSWVERGIISNEQAGKIRSLYPPPEESLPWGTILFGGFGAVIAGLGVILLLAYNWQEFPRFAKLGLVLVGVAGFHGAGIPLFMKQDRRSQVGEVLCLLGTMLFGAGIWLVAQAYHIDEHYPNGFLIWALGALALAWAMPSVAQALLATLLLSIWGCLESWEFRSPMHAAPLLLLFGVGSIAWRLRSRVLLMFILVGFIITLLGNVTSLGGWLVPQLFLDFGVLFVGLAMLSKQRIFFPESSEVWKVFGWMIFLFCVFLFAFPQFTEELMRHAKPSRGWLQEMYRWFPLVVALAAWGFAFLKGSSDEIKADSKVNIPQLEQLLLPLTVLLCHVFALTSIHEYEWFVAGIFNLVFLSFATVWMARGCQTGSLQFVILGSLLLIALVFARFFDLFDHLTARGLVFLVVGAVLLAEGIIFRRTRQLGTAKEVAP